MADYTPVFLPGLTITMVALTSLSGGDPVEIAGPGVVQKVAAAGSMKYLGICTADARAGLETTVVLDRVVHEGLADGVVSAGDQLMASPAPGRQVTTLVPAGTALPADINLARAIIGVAMTTAADGSLVRWFQR